MATQQQSKRQWIIWREDFATEDGYINEPAFRAAIVDELAAWEHVGHRLGRGLRAVPIRQQQHDGTYATTGWLFRDEFVPAVHNEDNQKAEPVEPRVDDDLEAEIADEEQVAEAA